MKISESMRHRLKIIWIAKIIWVAVCIMVLIDTLSSYDGTPNGEIGIFLAMWMTLLSLPSSLLFVLLIGTLYALLDKYFAIIISESYTELVLTWLGLFLVGYLQWFMLVPLLLKKLRGQSGQE